MISKLGAVVTAAWWKFERWAFPLEFTEHTWIGDRRLRFTYRSGWFTSRAKKIREVEL